MRSPSEDVYIYLYIYIYIYIHIHIYIYIWSRHASESRSSFCVYVWVQEQKSAIEIARATEPEKSERERECVQTHVCEYAWEKTLATERTRVCECVVRENTREGEDHLAKLFLWPGSPAKGDCKWCMWCVGVVCVVCGCTTGSTTCRRETLCLFLLPESRPKFAEGFACFVRCVCTRVCLKFSWVW